MCRTAIHCGCTLGSDTILNVYRDVDTNRVFAIGLFDLPDDHIIHDPHTGADVRLVTAEEWDAETVARIS